MTASRDELINLIEHLPDEQVETVLADVRRLTTETAGGEWPQRFFGIGESNDGRTDNARRSPVAVWDERSKLMITGTDAAGRPVVGSRPIPANGSMRGGKMYQRPKRSITRPLLPRKSNHSAIAAQKVRALV